MIVVNPRSVKEESVDPLETSVKEERDPSLDYSDSDSNQPLMIDFPGVYFSQHLLYPPFLNSSI